MLVPLLNQRMSVIILKVEPSSYGAEPVTSAGECPSPMAWTTKTSCRPRPQKPKEQYSPCSCAIRRIVHCVYHHAFHSMRIPFRIPLGPAWRHGGVGGVCQQQVRCCGISLQGLPSFPLRKSGFGDSDSRRQQPHGHSYIVASVYRMGQGKRRVILE